LARISKAKNTAVAAPDPDYPCISITGSVISVRPDTAASLTGATICFIEEQMRDGKLPFVRWANEKSFTTAIFWSGRRKSARGS
jgi:hypothetical protein